MPLRQRWRKVRTEPAPECPSCHGTKWATIVVQGHAYANGPCMCQPNGSVWASSEPKPKHGQ